MTREEALSYYIMKHVYLEFTLFTEEILRKRGVPRMISLVCFFLIEV